jgi:hypothetical protein
MKSAGREPSCPSAVGFCRFVLQCETPPVMTMKEKKSCDGISSRKLSSLLSNEAKYYNYFQHMNV